MAITGNQNFPNKNQVPDHSILDLFGKQAYLGNQFVASSGVVSLADTAEHPVMYLLNGAANTKSLFNGIRKCFAGDVTNLIVFRVYQQPTTVAAGSVITPTNSRLASATLSSATVKKSVTAVSNGTLIETLPIGFGYAPIESNNLLILDPGYSLLITAQAVAATTCVIEMVWWEL